jgi:cell division protein FtsI (penicillin-binding protein 3)
MRQDGIHSLKEYQRFYPQGRHAAQLLGFSGIDSRGLEGLEYQFDSHLMNNSAMPSSWRRLFSGSAVDNLSGGSLILTLNHKLQYFTEKELRKAVSVMRAKHGLAIVMESQTGNILALANMPDFDPNNFGRYNPNTYLNRSVSAWYEPGSTFKIITVASALESGAIEKEDIFNCEEGEYQIQDRVIHDVAKFGWLPLKKVIQYSSNICAAKIGQRLSRPVFYRMIHEFGCGKKTGIALPGEINGKVHDYQSWSDTDVATISYGHSITATPLQVLRAINVIATSGLLIKPRIVQKILSPQGIPISLGQHRGGKRILSENVSKIMKEFMISVIQPGGTGYLAKINGVSVAGKTGTSKKFDHKRQEYSSTNHIVSFVGFFPSDRPKLTILVTIDEPQQKYLRSKGAAPVFKKIAEHAIKYHQPESFINKSDRPPDSTVFSPVAFNPLTFQDKGTFSYKVMSLLKGKTLREVIQISDINAIKIRINGSGRVFRVTKSGFPDTIYTVELR